MPRRKYFSRPIWGTRGRPNREKLDPESCSRQGHLLQVHESRCICRFSMKAEKLDEGGKDQEWMRDERCQEGNKSLLRYKR